ncbi:MAG TPA: NADH-quinone oxidoreductase subunit C [Candidatus Limnocylindrales bacterium]|nr:NADH-quinone oxidoreductase subunit C [Candidatus Limnocylindrales bacterium]
MPQLANANAGVVIDRLRAWKSESVSQVIEYRGETTVVVPPQMLLAAARLCKEDPELNFNQLSDATCVDRFPNEPRFELNYQLLSIPRLARVRLRTSVSGQQPVIDSLEPLWPGANWMEREIFDLFGIRFEGHSDLRRILLPDEFEGAPLRRDFPVEGKR